MAEVYPRIGGKKIEKWLAQRPEVQRGLTWTAHIMANQAKRNLLAHRFEGLSKVGVEKGKIDRYIVLYDKDENGSAWAIEFGRRGQPRKNASSRERYTRGGGMKGLRILRDAAGIR